jgi:hypothetical protein
LRLASGAGKERIIRVYGFGVGGGGDEDDEGALPDWLPGAMGVLIIAIIGVVILYYPLRKKFREAGR